MFSGAIAGATDQPEDGEIVEVVDFKEQVLGVGHFHHGSIAVRLLSFGESNPEDKVFWVHKLQNALEVRKICGLLKPGITDTYRLVHGEGDGLSGLIIDIYGKTAVVQCHSIGMYLQKEIICAALREVLAENLLSVYDKSVESLPQKFALHQKNGLLWSDGEQENSAIVSENGIRFKVDWATGQKTGFFLDQRDNRQMLAQFTPGKTVLNTFCYTGGFSCYAAESGAKSVTSVDISAKAMELTDENVALNNLQNIHHQSITGDVMQFLKDEGKQFEVMVVDPPAFAKTLDKRHNAVQGYKRLNALAFERLAPNGIMFTFSCSQVIDRELFYNTIAAAAIEAGREIRVLRHLTQGSDHPVSMFHPEGAYLKGLILHAV